jgi:hypothetical protein
MGGGVCRQDSDCGVRGEGATCEWAGCECAHDQTGPRCRTRAYKNDFPDWDQEGIPPLQLPDINAFLVTALVGVAVTGLVATLLVVKGGSSTVVGKTNAKWLWL